MSRSRLGNKDLKYPCRENFVNMEKMKNILTLFAENPKYNISKEVQKKGFLQVNRSEILLNHF